jgi:hypothetical protein
MNMNEHNEEEWDLHNEPEDIANFNQMVDAITGFLIGLIVAAIAFLLF